MSQEKKQILLDVFTKEPIRVDNFIHYFSEGLKSSKTAKCAGSGHYGTIDSIFHLFERNWAAHGAYSAMTDPTNEIILELGCAEQPLYEAFKVNYTYPNYIGMDIRADYLSNSPHRGRKDVIAAAVDLNGPVPLKDESISQVILNEVLEHLSEETNKHILREVYRVLKPGGNLWLGMPVNLRDRIFHEDESNVGHVFFWNTEDLEEECKKIGFASFDKKWGYSTSSKITVSQLKKQMSKDVQDFIDKIGDMYGGPIRRALMLSYPDIPNGGSRFKITK